jgi:hypothetical protein
MHILPSRIQEENFHQNPTATLVKHATSVKYRKRRANIGNAIWLPRVYATTCGNKFLCLSIKYEIIYYIYVRVTWLFAIFMDKT